MERLDRALDSVAMVEGEMSSVVMIRLICTEVDAVVVLAAEDAETVAEVDRLEFVVDVHEDLRRLVVAEGVVVDDIGRAQHSLESSDLDHEDWKRVVVCIQSNLAVLGLVQAQSKTVC